MFKNYADLPLSGGEYGNGITSLRLQILSRSSRYWFDITPVAGTRKARLHRLVFSVVRGWTTRGLEFGLL